MNKALTPAEIARDALKTLLTRKLPPTPENYTAVYREIAGEPEADEKAETDAEPLAWGELIRNLLRQLETPHKGITLTRKREGLETVLARFASKPDALFEKLDALQRSWAGTPTAEELPLSAPPPADAPPPSAPVAPPAPLPQSNEELIRELRELLAKTLEYALSLHPELHEEVKNLTAQVRNSNSTQLKELSSKLRHFWLKLELRGSDKLKIQEGLVRLLRLLVENVGELVADDQWLHGQILTLQEIIANPIDKRVIADAERNLRDAIIKQGMLQQSLIDARTTLKGLMANFIDQLGSISASTGEYHSRIQGYSQKIREAGNLADLGHLLEDIMQDTRQIQESALRSHQELEAAKKQADEAEARIRQLEQELQQVSEKVREDQLTGALNRRGLDETLGVELHRAERMATPLSLALLDIDNFKRLNDTRGHQAGDQALVHLAQVIKDCMRPTDSVARYGGEEFIIILPNTGLEEAVEVVQRLQRELTKRFFLHNNERILITFSAGVALRGPGEDQEDLIGRADKAMYVAKHSGKNRVEAAPPYVPPARE